MSQEETTLFAGFEKGVGSYGQTLDKRQVGQRNPRETSAPPTSRKCGIPINDGGNPGSGHSPSSGRKNTCLSRDKFPMATGWEPGAAPVASGLGFSLSQ